MKQKTFYRYVSLISQSALVLMLAFPAIYYTQLPEQIPIHFNFNGQADAYGAKSNVWTMPIIGLLLYVGLFFINTYLKKKLENTTKNEYLRAIYINRMLVLLIALAFCYISIQTVLVSLNKSDGLGVWFIPVFVLGSIVLPLWPLVMKKKT
ncbi:MAG: DUF1648 domain-containing protein [Flavobacteriaceae bacterium]|nr:DUF1648 domain-containing protein [Flavobacteriaceae bacterium]